MRATVLWTLAAAAMLSVAGCNKAESPAKVDSDVASAANEAAENDAKATQEQARTEAEANQAVTEEQNKADAKSADASADTIETQAEGDNKVALAKCEALSGAAQKTCRDQANAALDAVKARVKAMKSDHS